MQNQRVIYATAIPCDCFCPSVLSFPLPASPSLVCLSVLRSTIFNSSRPLITHSLFSLSLSLTAGTRYSSSSNEPGVQSPSSAYPTPCKQALCKRNRKIPLVMKAKIPKRKLSAQSLLLFHNSNGEGRKENLRKKNVRSCNGSWLWIRRQISTYAHWRTAIAIATWLSTKRTNLIHPFLNFNHFSSNALPLNSPCSATQLQRTLSKISLTRSENISTT